MAPSPSPLPLRAPAPRPAPPAPATPAPDPFGHLSSAQIAALRDAAGRRPQAPTAGPAVVAATPATTLTDGAERRRGSRRMRRTPRVPLVVTLVGAVALGLALAALGVVRVPTGARPAVTAHDATAVALEPADPGSGTLRARAERNLVRAHALTAFLHRSVGDYSTTAPATLARLPSNLTFIDPRIPSTGPDVVSVWTPAAHRLVIASSADGVCAYLRDDRRTGRIEQAAVANGPACTAMNAPAEGWSLLR